MNFDFSDDQKTIQEQARLMLGRECPPSLVRDSLESSPPEVDALWQQMVSLGWPAMAIDEANGGLGLAYGPALEADRHGVGAFIGAHALHGIGLFCH